MIELEVRQGDGSWLARQFAYQHGLNCLAYQRAKGLQLYRLPQGSMYSNLDEAVQALNILLNNLPLPEPEPCCGGRKKKK